MPPRFDVTLTAAPDAVVYTAVRGDSPYRSISIRPGTAYEIAHEDGTPDGHGGVVAIELFAVPPAEDERFLASWAEEHDDLAARQGYLGTRLLRALGDAEFRFVELRRWSSPLMVQRAGITQPLLFRATRPRRP